MIEIPFIRFRCKKTILLNLINNSQNILYVSRHLTKKKFCLSLPCHLFVFFIIVISDTLTDMVNQMTEKVGLVHGLPYVADRQGFAATLEQVSVMVINNILIRSRISQKLETILRAGITFWFGQDQLSTNQIFV